jgi:ribosome-binding protein aMBF1 (putative translation factor)
MILIQFLVKQNQASPELIVPEPIISCPTARKNENVLHMPSIQVRFGRSVRRLRLQRRLSQESLAELAGLHATYIGRIERGRQNISLNNIGKIAHALKVKPRELFKTLH